MKKIKIAYYEQTMLTNCKEFIEIEVPVELDVGDEDALIQYLDAWSEVEENNDELMELDFEDDFESDIINYGFRVIRDDEEELNPEFIQTSYRV